MKLLGYEIIIKKLSKEKSRKEIDESNKRISEAVGYDNQNFLISRFK